MDEKVLRSSLKDKILAISIIGSVFLALFGAQTGNWVVYTVAVIIYISAALYIEWDKCRSFKLTFKNFFIAISEPFIELWKRIVGA